MGKSEKPKNKKPWNNQFASLISVFRFSLIFCSPATPYLEEVSMSDLQIGEI